MGKRVLVPSARTEREELGRKREITRFSTVRISCAARGGRKGRKDRERQLVWLARKEGAWKEIARMRDSRSAARVFG